MKIEATKLVVEKSPINIDLTINMLSKVNYPAVISAVEDIKSSSSSLDDVDESSLSPIISMIPDNIPTELPGCSDSNSSGGGDNDDVASSSYDTATMLRESLDESTLKSLHFILFNLHVLEGSLICPDTGRKFPIKDGIPNMILHEDEI